MCTIYNMTVMHSCKHDSSFCLFEKKKNGHTAVISTDLLEIAKKSREHSSENIRQLFSK